MRVVTMILGWLALFLFGLTCWLVVGWALIRLIRYCST